MVDDFKNVVINGVHSSRFIASWLRAGGKLNTGKDVSDFKKWLKSLGLSDEDVRQVWYLATNGKLELQENAKKFIGENC